MRIKLHPLVLLGLGTVAAWGGWWLKNRIALALALLMLGAAAWNVYVVRARRRRLAGIRQHKDGR